MCFAGGGAPRGMCCFENANDVSKSLNTMSKSQVQE